MTKILIAYSGGVDSTVLLHQLVHSHPRDSLRALHINHALYPEANAWQAHCEQTCKAYGIPLIVVTLSTQPPAGESIEAWARDQRRTIFKDTLHPGEQLMTAHHADDQAETVLLQLIRGAGPKGLSAMATEMPFGAGTLVRPLLHWTKAALMEYAQEHQLTWITDHSNHDQQFDRNFLRQTVMPALQARWPSVTQTVSRAAAHCAEQERLVRALLTPLYSQIGGSRPGTLSIKALQAHPPVIQRALIRHWLAEKQFPAPNQLKFERIFDNVLSARPDANPKLVWGEFCIRRYRDDLYALTLEETRSLKGLVIEWDGKTPLTLPHGAGVLEPQENLIGPLTLHFDPQGLNMKKSFQNRGIPPWERERTPIITLAN